jgi:uncharacterized protein (TIGR03067 family)
MFAAVAVLSLCQSILCHIATEQNRRDMEILQGLWQKIASVKNGEEPAIKFPAAVVDSLTTRVNLRFRGQEAILTFGEDLISKWTFSLDNRFTLRRIKLDRMENNKKVTWFCLYRLTDRNLEFAYFEDSERYPTSFEQRQVIVQKYTLLSRPLASK